MPDNDPPWLDPVQLAAWIRLTQVLHWLPAKLDEALKPHGLNTFEYGILAGLSDAPGQQVSMTLLSSRAFGSQSRVSHAVKRLEARGWLHRRASADDGRVTMVEITKEGLAHLAAVAPAHVASVREAVFDHLTDEQVRNLGEALAAVARGMGPLGELPDWVPTGPWD